MLRVSLECVPLPQMWPLLPPSVGLSSVRGNGRCSAPMSSRWVPCHHYLVSEASVLAAWNNDFKSTWSLSFKSETSGPIWVASSFSDSRGFEQPDSRLSFPQRAGQHSDHCRSLSRPSQVNSGPTRWAARLQAPLPNATVKARHCGSTNVTDDLSWP